MGRSRGASESLLRDQIERLAHRTAVIGTVVEERRGPVNTPAWILLRLLHQLGPSRASDLATRSRLSRPWVSRCLSALTEAGLVRSTPDPRDGRASLVAMTEAGERYVDRFTVAGQQRLNEITADFTTAEVAQLAALLTRLNDSADRHAVTAARYGLERLSS